MSLNAIFHKTALCEEQKHFFFVIFSEKIDHHSSSL